MTEESTTTRKTPRLLAASLDKESILILLKAKERIEKVGGTFIFTAFLRRIVMKFGLEDVSDIPNEDRMKDIAMTPEMDKYYITSIHSWDTENRERFAQIKERIEREGGDFNFSAYIRKLIKKFADRIGEE